MGTIFPELVSPYTPCQSMRTNEFLESTNQIGEGCNMEDNRNWMMNNSNNMNWNMQSQMV